RFIRIVSVAVFARTRTGVRSLPAGGARMTRWGVLGLAGGISGASYGCGSISKYEAAGLTGAGGGTMLLQGNTGIASRHPGDAGIGSDPDVIFADDFEG